jgi:chromosome segregation ATPase
MYNIRRVFLDYVGYDDAWFENVEIPLFDSKDEQAKSSIISLTNGGGKTTLLSLIFSCFIPEKRLFVQHLQKPHHRFEDYFNEQPGLILIELTRSSTENEIPDDYPWIVGQFVSVNEISKEDDRTYFAFKSSNQLTFEDVPYVSKGDFNITNITSVRRWIDKVKTIGDAFFSSHQNQTEWYKYLNNVVQIDTWTLSKQVDFCRAEGGIDAYMNFRSEKHFLKEFFHMVMPPGKSEEVREVLSVAVNKLRKKPEYEKNKALLTGLKAKLEPFTDDASAMIFAKKELSDKKQLASRLHKTLNQVFENKRNEIENHKVALDNKQEQEQILNKEIKTNIAYSEALRSLYFQNEVNSKLMAINNSESELSNQKQKKQQIKAALILHEKRAIEAKINDFQISLDQAGSDLTPFTLAMKTAAGRYLTKLKQIKQKKEAKKEILQQTEFTTQQRLKTLQIEKEELNSQKTVLSEASGKVESKIEQRNLKHARLVTNGVLQETDDVWKLIKETSGLIEIKSKAISLLETEKNDIQEKLTHFDSEINEISAKIGALNVTLITIQQKLNKCLEKKKELQRNGILFQLADGDEAFEPGSVKINQELKSFLVRKEEERNDLLLKQSHLVHQSAFIEETESLLMDQDAKKALDFLRDNGLPKTEFFPDFLHHTLEDPVKVKSIIETDPGRFLGLMVNGKDEIAKAATLKTQIDSLEKPVMVSLWTGLDQQIETSIPEDRIILPPKSGEVYDKNKVNDKLKALVSEKSHLEDRIDKNGQLHDQIRKAQQQLSIYLDEYGPEVQAKYSLELDQTSSALNETQKRSEALRASKNQLHQKHSTLDQDQLNLNHQKTELEHRLVAIRDFNRDFEKNHEQSLVDFSELKSQLEAFSLTNEIIERERSMLDKKRIILIDDRVQLSSDIENYQSKINDIADIDILEVENSASEGFQSEADLKNSYNARREAYQNALSDKGFHALKASMDNARENLVSKNAEYERQKKDLPEEKIIKLAETEKDDLLFLKEETEQKIGHLHKENGSLLNQLDQTEKEKKAFEASRKYPKQKYEGDEISIEEINDQLTIYQEKALEAEETTSRIVEEIKKLINIITSLKQELTNSETLLKVLSNHVPEHSDQIFETMILPESQAEISEMVTQCNDDIARSRKKFDQANAVALKSYQKVIEITQQEEFRSLENRTAVELMRNPFEDACRFAKDHLKSTEDRIAALTDEIDKTKQDLEICLDHLKNHTQTALGKISSALKHARIPTNVSDLGNRKILRLTTNLSGISTEQRKIQLEGFINDLISAQRIPNTSNDSGDELTAEAVIAIAKAKNRQGKLGIELIKLSQTISYSPVDQIKGSGGESMTAALLLYLVLAQMRVESRIGVKQAPGGFLLLDNPFARATTPQLVEPQVQLAEALGFQLIYATAIKDFNAQSCFSHIVQLRKVAHDRTHNRTHVGRIESAEFTACEKP